MAVISDLDLKKLLEDYEVIDAKELKGIWEESQTLQKSLGDLLLDKGLINDTHLGQIIADFLKVPFINLAGLNIGQEALTILPEVVAKKQLAICFGTGAKGFKMALANPSDIEIARLVTKTTGEKVEVFFATERDIKDALRKYHKDLQKEFEDLIKEHLTELENSSPSEQSLKEVPIINIVDSVLQYAYYNRASDVHIEPQDRVTVIRFRIDGILHDVLSIPKGIHEQVVTRLKILSELRTDDHFSAQDGKFRMDLDDDKLDVRVSVVPITGGEKVVMRLLSEKVRQFSLEDLGLSPDQMKVLNEAIDKPHGMILATGPTGSGKTTTLYALLKVLNHRDINIATIEDPVEYEIEGVNQIQVNVRTNLTYAMGLKSILRQDPDVIMVGEVRDNETAGMCINAALTGHLVLSSLHTNDAATTLPRLLDMSVEPFLIGSTVNIVIAQRLVRKICTGCISSFTMEGEDLEKYKKKLGLERILNKKLDKLRLYQGKGCPVCSNKGFRGRTGIYELLVVDDAVRQLITSRANASQIKEQALKNGMVPMIVDGINKAMLGLTTFEEVLRVAME
ncbi:type II/IV secretion system protein [Candidatus Uhrbacteria bacterium]|nr:type II/IV secretion system protein [Candidatus Uhrbacteria bacterium]